MSFQALAWAAEQRTERSADKLLLFALADRHNTEEDIARPSIAWLGEFTRLDRKTVISGLNRLRDGNFIEDTGQRFGATGQVKGHRLCFERDPELSIEERRQNYVYRLTEERTGRFYLGVRSCRGDPHIDPYKGSGMWPNGMKFLGTPLQKTVIASFPNRALAEQMEVAMIREAAGDPLCMNRLHNVKRNSSDLGTVKKGAVFSRSRSRKRDTEPVRNQHRNKKSTAREISEDWKPSPTLGSKTSEFMKSWPTGFEESEVERFIAYHLSHETKSENFNRQWATWALGPYCREALRKWNDERSGEGGPFGTNSLANLAARRAGGNGSATEQRRTNRLL